MRIGIFGGSFDPVHSGHLLVALAALEEARLDRLFFVPANCSPFKPGAATASGMDRLKWLRLALAGEVDYEVDGSEIDRGGVSYSVDTVRDYARRFAGAELFYLIGADHVQTLPKWRDASELAVLTRFLVVPRPGQAVSPFPVPFTGEVLGGIPVSISSSEIRRRLRAGLSIRPLVPAAVAEALELSLAYGSDPGGKDTPRHPAKP